MAKLLILALTCLGAAAQPPPGPRDVAICPVTGKNMSTSDMYPLGLFNGQTLFFATKDDASTYGKDPRSYWLAPTDSTPEQGLLPMPDGARGLPDLRNTTVQCSAGRRRPSSTISGSTSTLMATARACTAATSAPATRRIRRTAP